MSTLDDFVEEEVVENPTLRAAYNAEPLHQNQPLHWDYEVNLIGEKIYDKTIHLCEVCELPILVYGRMLPCKHIFCFDCARKCDKTCVRCDDKVQKVEKSVFGTVYVCTHGAPKHSFKGCRRTYLSQRDLQSHFIHRHTPKTTSSKQPSVQQGSSVVAPVQPVPNQLPMTQQQAQQQASQQKQQQINMGQAQGTSRGLLSPSQGQGMPVPQQVGTSGMMTSTSVQSSPLIPGLGGLGSGVSSQIPGHLQTSISPKPQMQHQSQSMNMSYLGQTIQHNPSDVYRPLDLDSLLTTSVPPQQRQIHQTQQQQGLRTASGIPPGSQPSFGQPANFQLTPPPSQLPPPQQHQQQQQMGVSPAQQTMLSPGMHMGQQQQRHMETFSPQNPPPNAVSSPMAMPMASASQSRTNNLITVPIQDEGQYRPLPYVNTSAMNQPNAPVSSFNTQAQAGTGTYAQSFAQQRMSAGFQAQQGGGIIGPQGQGMMGGAPEDQSHNLAYNQGVGNTQSSNFNSVDSHRNAMGMSFSQPGGQAVPPRLSFNHNNAPGMQSYPQGLRINPMRGMGRGNNITRGLVQAISMVAAASRPHSVNAGSGMMSTGPGPNSQSGAGSNRFPVPPPGRWPRHGMQPRMGGNQSQPRPHDANFNQGPFY